MVTTYVKKSIILVGVFMTKNGVRGYYFGWNKWFLCVRWYRYRCLYSRTSRIKHNKNDPKVATCTNFEVSHRLDRYPFPMEVLLWYRNKGFWVISQFGLKKLHEKWVFKENTKNGSKKVVRILKNFRGVFDPQTLGYHVKTLLYLDFE